MGFGKDNGTFGVRTRVVSTVPQPTTPVPFQQQETRPRVRRWTPPTTTQRHTPKGTNADSELEGPDVSNVDVAEGHRLSPTDRRTRLYTSTTPTHRHPTDWEEGTGSQRH